VDCRAFQTLKILRKHSITCRHPVRQCSGSQWPTGGNAEPEHGGVGKTFCPLLASCLPC